MRTSATALRLLHDLPPLRVTPSTSLSAASVLELVRELFGFLEMRREDVTLAWKAGVGSGELADSRFDQLVLWFARQGLAPADADVAAVLLSSMVRARIRLWLFRGAPTDGLRLAAEPIVALFFEQLGALAEAS